MVSSKQQLKKERRQKLSAMSTTLILPLKSRISNGATITGGWR
jgi:hypothetical protein